MMQKLQTAVGVHTVPKSENFSIFKKLSLTELQMAYINYIKVLFAVVTLLFSLISFCFNYLENYLPLYIKRFFKYGKCAYTAKGTASILQIEVPKIWFKHFYIYSSFISTFAVSLMISSLAFDVTLHPLVLNILNIVGGSITHTKVSGVSGLIAICLFTLHCYRRLYETYLISVFANDGRISLWYYIMAFIHYTGAVLAILIETPKFTRMTSKGSALNWTDLTFIDVAAVLLFFWASWHQNKIAIILANLRKDEKGVTVTHSHKLPHGDWFDYLSSPHFVAEVLIYFALNIILWNNATWTYVFIWVLINQSELALVNHWWYQAKFEEMPKDRKAIIPFIY